jgi:hypothetical protein
MNSNGQTGQSGKVANPDPARRVLGTSDFNSDGKTDIVLQNNNGAVAAWDMNGSTNQPVRRSPQPRRDIERHR